MLPPAARVVGAVRSTAVLNACAPVVLKVPPRDTLPAVPPPLGSTEKTPTLLGLPTVPAKETAAPPRSKLVAFRPPDNTVWPPRVRIVRSW